MGGGGNSFFLFLPIFLNLLTYLKLVVSVMLFDVIIVASMGALDSFLFR